MSKIYGVQSLFVYRKMGDCLQAGFFYYFSFLVPFFCFCCLRFMSEEAGARWLTHRCQRTMSFLSSDSTETKKENTNNSAGFGKQERSITRSGKARKNVKWRDTFQLRSRKQVSIDCRLPLKRFLLLRVVCRTDTNARICLPMKGTCSSAETRPPKGATDVSLRALVSWRRFNWWPKFKKNGLPTVKDGNPIGGAQI